MLFFSATAEPADQWSWWDNIKMLLWAPFGFALLALYVLWQLLVLLWAALVYLVLPVLLLLALLVFLSGCANWDRTAGSWTGRTIDDLIYAWGPPSNAADLPDGRRTVTFSHSRDITGTSYYCNATFRSDHDGVIVSHSIDGNIGGCNRLFGGKPSS